MKLLFCPSCQDIFNLKMEEKSCSCGRTSGRYLEDGVTVYYKHGIPLGFTNSSFSYAVKNQRRTGEYGTNFIAFVIPKLCEKCIKV